MVRRTPPQLRAAGQGAGQDHVLEVIGYPLTAHPTDLLPPELITGFGGLATGDPGPPVRVTVTGDEPLPELMLRVASDLAGIPIPDTMIWSMWIELIGNEGNRIPWTVMVDNAGQAAWEFNPTDQTVADLLRSLRDRVVGSTREDAIYLVVDAEAGFGGGHSIEYWHDLSGVIAVSKPYIEALGEAATAWTIVAGLRKVVRRLRREWQSRGGDLEKFDNLFQVPRTTDQVATLLGCDVREVECVCESLGFSLDRTGVWRLSDKPSARARRDWVLTLGEISQWHVSAQITKSALHQLSAYPDGRRRENAASVLSALVNQAPPSDLG